MKLCILGHSGIGKSPLGRLFKVPTWEPFRVRTPRNPLDGKTCKTQQEFDELLESQKSKYGDPLYRSHPHSENPLIVYPEWSFFKVRGTNQCLPHIEAARKPGSALRVEIFAPVLVEMIENQEKFREAFTLDIPNMLFVLLNPTSESFKDMHSPSLALSLATLSAITERSRLYAAGVDLAESLRRVEHLKQELKAWKQLLGIIPNTVECLHWPHFEFRYSVPIPNLGNAQAELTKARCTLLQAIARQASHLHDPVEQLMRTPDEIAELAEIV